MTVNDLEGESKVSRYTWRSWIAQKKIPVVRIGRRVRVDRADFERFIAERKAPARENGQ
jgi:excisionase family DNA binding protein